MAFKSEEKTIGDLTFKVNTLPYSVSQKVLVKAKQLLMVKIGDTGSFGEDASPLSAAIFLDIDEEDLEFVVAKLADYSQVKQTGGEWLDLAKQKEVIFAGSIEVMFAWLDFALGVNYGRFLENLKSATASQQAKMAPPSRKK